MTKFAGNHSSGQDYSGVTLDQMWASVSQPDNLTWPQIAAWDVMAQVCADQAEQLHRSLSSLLQTWPPLPNSAAEAFAQNVGALTTAMRRDAADANEMQPVLASISSELGVAKARMQSLMDQQDQFLAIEQARSKFGTPEFNMMDPASRDLAAQPLPNGWREDLHAQGTAVMRTADDNLAVITAGMPVLTEFHSTADEPGGSGPSSGGRSNPLPLIQGPTVVVKRQSTPISLDQLHTGSISAPVLAGNPFDERPQLEKLDAFGGHERGGPTTSQVPSPETGSQAYPVGRVVGLPRLAPSPGPSEPAAAGEDRASLVGEDRPTASPRAAPTGSMIAPPPVGRGQPAARSTVRPGGRAALWASQRKRKKSDPTDPWAVREGVPMLIEPSEPAEHDPGPGVIGLDR